jgi:HAD domain in Swiss Army Knife RNA repair proteins
MKVIFLDHDGVICLYDNWGTRIKKQTKWGGRKLSMGPLEIPIEYRFDNFDEKAVEVLNEILEKTGAEIVVSSDWKRWATVEEMGQYYELKGIIKKPIAFTDSILYDDYADFPWHNKWELEQTRSLEISQYLGQNPEITHWVSIDDLNMSLRDGDTSWGLKNFVLTPRQLEGIKQSGIKEKVLEFLL